MAFPTDIPPAGTAITTQTLSEAGHTALHNDDRDNIRALSQKIGTGSATPDTNQVLVGNGTGTSTWSTSLSGLTLGVANYIDFDEIAEPSNPAASDLRLWAESNGGFGQLHFKNSNGLDYQLGRDNIHTVRNNSGVTISKGEWVYISGSTGQFPEVTKARANSMTTMPAAGMAVADISDSSFGQIMTEGDIQGIDTSAFNAGDILYVSTATAGASTTTEPTGTNIDQRVGVVVTSNPANGVIAVLVGDAINPGQTATLTNKSIDGDNNTITNIPIYNQTHSIASMDKFANQTITSEATVASWDAETSSSDDVTLNTTTGKATINTAGTYRVHYSVTAIVSSGTARSSMIIRPYLGNAATLYARHNSYIYLRQASYAGSASREFYYTFSASDEFYITAERDTGTDTIAVDNCVISLERIT